MGLVESRLKLYAFENGFAIEDEGKDASNDRVYRRERGEFWRRKKPSYHSVRAQYKNATRTAVESMVESVSKDIIS